MDDTAKSLTLRQSQAVWVPVVIWVFCAIVLVDALIEGSTSYVLHSACLTAAGAYAAYFFLARPSLKLDEDGLTVVNVLRTYRVPFGALIEVRSGGLTSVLARTGNGTERKITSWNAPGVPRRLPRGAAAPGFSGLGHTPHVSRPPLAGESQVEALIGNRWDAWSAAHPSGSPQSSLVVTWNVRPGSIALALVLLNIAIGLR